MARSRAVHCRALLTLGSCRRPSDLPLYAAAPPTVPWRLPPQLIPPIPSGAAARYSAELNLLELRTGSVFLGFWSVFGQSWAHDGSSWKNAKQINEHQPGRSILRHRETTNLKSGLESKSTKQNPAQHLRLENQVGPPNRTKPSQKSPGWCPSTTRVRRILDRFRGVSTTIPNFQTVR